MSNYHIVVLQVNYSFKPVPYFGFTIIVKASPTICPSKVYTAQPQNKIKQKTSIHSATIWIILLHFEDRDTKQKALIKHITVFEKSCFYYYGAAVFK